MTGGADAVVGRRILLVAARYPPHHTTAAEFRLRDVALGLTQRGHTVSVLCGADAVEPEDDQPVRVVRRLPRVSMDDERVWPAVTSGRRFRSEVALFRPDAVVFSHLTGISESVLGVDLPSSVIVASDVGSDWLRDLALPHGGWFASWATPASGALARVARAVRRMAAGGALGAPIVPPPLPRGRTWFWSRRRWKACLAGGLPVHGATLLEPGIDLRGFQFRERAELGTPVRVLFSEPIERSTGLHTLVLALGDLPGSVRLRVCGAVQDEGYLAEVAELGRAAGVMDRIEIAAPPSGREMPDVVAAADMLVYGREEPERFPRRPLEAFAVGTPVIATDASEGSDLFQNDATSLTFPPGNVPELTRQLRRILDDPALRRTLTLAARAKVERDYALGYTLAQIEEALFVDASA